MANEDDIFRRAIQPSDTHSPDLRCIKALFLHGKHRQCISMCREMLQACHDDHADDSDLRRTFLYFYMALSHDVLAREMHDHSQFKVGMFNDAEKHYEEALEALNAFSALERQELATICLDDNAADPDTFSLEDEQSALSPERISSPRSEYNEVGEGTQSPPAQSPGSVQTSAEDLESHDSFGDIMTPTRVLRRDVSRMSLLDRGLPRDVSRMSLVEGEARIARSTSQGLLRPIRLGSPPKQHHVPPKLPYVGLMPSRSKIPQPPRGTVSPTRQAGTLRLRGGSPVMSNRSVGGTVDHTPVPPTLPLTSGPSGDVPKHAIVAHVDVRRLDEHLMGMRKQLNSHITLVQQSKLRTTIAQAERTVARSTPPISTDLRDVSNQFIDKNLKTGKKSMQPSRSYWSFTPEDFKSSEKKRRIDAGRARGWQRNTFRPERYMALAEKALAEL